MSTSISPDEKFFLTVALVAAYNILSFTYRNIIKGRGIDQQKKTTYTIIDSLNLINYIAKRMSYIHSSSRFKGRG